MYLWARTVSDRGLMSGGVLHTPSVCSLAWTEEKRVHFLCVAVFIWPPIWSRENKIMHEYFRVQLQYPDWVWKCLWSSSSFLTFIYHREASELGLFPTMCPTVWHLQKIHCDICTHSDIVPIILCQSKRCWLLAVLLLLLRGQKLSGMDDSLFGHICGDVTKENLLFNKAIIPDIIINSSRLI